MQIWRAGHALGFNMFGDGKDGAIDCLGNNIVALPGMIVRVAVGVATHTYDEQGNIVATEEPYSYHALVTACQRSWDPIGKSYKVAATSTCAVQVLRFDFELKRFFHDNKTWITTELALRDIRKYRVAEIITTDVLSAENIVKMVPVAWYPHKNRLEYKVQLGPHMLACMEFPDGKLFFMRSIAV